LSRAEDKAATLERLRKVGREVLVEVGVTGASVHQIAARAGIATGSFYLHFPSKAAFVDSIVAELNQGLVQRMLGVLSSVPQPTAPVLLDRLAVAVVEYWAENIDAIPLFADHLARNASEEILRIGTNKQSVGMVRRIIAAVPSVTLRTTPEFLVANIVALWRASGLLAFTFDAEARAQAARDLAAATRALLTEFAPGALDLDLSTLMASLAQP
jgi:AcrR family transcriptional regulator